MSDNKYRTTYELDYRRGSKPMIRGKEINVRGRKKVVSKRQLSPAEIRWYNGRYYIVR